MSLSFDHPLPSASAQGNFDPGQDRGQSRPHGDWMEAAEEMQGHLPPCTLCGAIRPEMNKPQKAVDNIEIVQQSDGKLAVIINGGPPVHITKTQAALLGCLYEHPGLVVPYEKLLLILDYQSAGQKQLHTLQQHMAWIRHTIAKHQARYVIAGVRDVGYALCELAPD
jgi:hypothetical protein